MWPGIHTMRMKKWRLFRGCVNWHHYKEIKMAAIKATIFFDKRFWVGTFERTDKEGYAVARHIFGAEPSDPEVHEFVLSHYVELKFGEAKEVSLQIQRM